MTQSKAAGGMVAGHLVTIALWLLTKIPGWDQIPTEPRLAIAALVISGIGWACVYFAPANKQVVNVQPVSFDVVGPLSLTGPPARGGE